MLRTPYLGHCIRNRYQKMIDRNIGGVERIIRFALAVLLIGSIFTSDRFGVVHGVGLLIAAALLWNSIFARCYLWKWVGVSTCNPDREDCRPRGGPGTSNA